MTIVGIVFFIFGFLFRGCISTSPSSFFEKLHKDPSETLSNFLLDINVCVFILFVVLAPIGCVFSLLGGNSLSDSLGGVFASGGAVFIFLLFSFMIIGAIKFCKDTQ